MSHFPALWVVPSPARSSSRDSGVCPPGGSVSVDPANGDPLGLKGQPFHHLLQLLEGLVQIVIDNGQVEVVAVGPADSRTLIHSLLKVRFLLQRERESERGGGVHTVGIIEEMPCMKYNIFQHIETLLPPDLFKLSNEPGRY